jgi:hypothetical protein
MRNAGLVPAFSSTQTDQFRQLCRSDIGHLIALGAAGALHRGRDAG